VTSQPRSTSPTQAATPATGGRTLISRVKLGWGKLPRRVTRPLEWAGRRWYVCLVVCLDLALLAGLGYVKEAVNHTQLMTVHVAAGSEDVALFQDPRTIAELASNNLTVDVTAMGSGTIASSADLSEYGAFIVSSQYFADLTLQRINSQKAKTQGVKTALPGIDVFSTPLMVFTWKRLLPLLEHTGIVVTGPGHLMQFSITGYFTAVIKGKRWNKITGNNIYPNPNPILLLMTDPTQSDSGAMFVAAAGEERSGGSPGIPPADMGPAAKEIGQVISDQGEPLPTTHDVYTSFVQGQQDGVPLALGYESELKPAASDGHFPADAIGLPLSTDVACEHILIPFTGPGKTLGHLLATDPVLQDLERQYDFQPGAEPAPGTYLPDIGYLSPPPFTSVLERLINAVEADL
jgi:hypothetical protein